MAENSAAAPYVTALRSYAPSAGRQYAPNAFAGGPARPAPVMAPHLSVAARDRPMAEDIAMFTAGGGKAPVDFDRMWRHNPLSYQTKVAAALRDPKYAVQLGNARANYEITGYDEQGNPQFNKLPDYSSSVWETAGSDGGGD